MIPNIIYTLDKERHLRWSLRARMEFEKTSNIMLTTLQKNATTEAFIKICHTMLKQEDNDLTLDKTIDLIEEYSSFDEMIDKIYEAFEAAQPKNSQKPVGGKK